MAKLPKNLTVSANSPYQLLARLSVTERLALLNSVSGRTYLDSLTPTEYALLFPSYYKKEQTKFMKGGTAQPVAGGLTRASYTPSGQPSVPSATRGTQPPVSQPSAPARPQPAPSPNAKFGWQKDLDEIVEKYGKKDEKAEKQPTYTGKGFAGRLSAYSPRAGGDSMEGGYESSRKGPDGKNIVRTLDDYANGRSQYVTIAGNPKLYNKEFIIPEITYIDKNGNSKTLRNVRAVVHDTGSAFRNASSNRFDIPIDRDASNSLMSQNHSLWSKQGVRFIPRDEAVLSQPDQQPSQSEKSTDQRPKAKFQPGIGERVKYLGEGTQSALERYRVAEPNTQISSTYRSPTHPIERRKSKPGAHARGEAIDVSTRGKSEDELKSMVKSLKRSGFNYILLEGNPPHIHAEVRPNQTDTVIRNLGAGHPTISLESAREAASGVRYNDIYLSEQMNKEKMVETSGKKEIIAVGGINKYESFDEQKSKFEKAAGEGANLRFFNHKEKIDIPKGFNGKVVLYSAGYNRIKEFLDAGVKPENIVVIEPSVVDKSRQEQLKKYADMGVGIYYGKESSRGYFPGIENFPNAKRHDGTHFDVYERATRELDFGVSAAPPKIRMPDFYSALPESFRKQLESLPPDQQQKYIDALSNAPEDERKAFVEKINSASTAEQVKVASADPIIPTQTAPEPPGTLPSTTEGDTFIGKSSSGKVYPLQGMHHMKGNSSWYRAERMTSGGGNRLHYGTDLYKVDSKGRLQVGENAKVVADEDGVIEKIVTNRTFDTSNTGNFVVIRYKNGKRSTAMHLGNKMLINPDTGEPFKEDDTIKAGTAYQTVGGSGTKFARYVRDRMESGKLSYEEALQETIKDYNSNRSKYGGVTAPHLHYSGGIPGRYEDAGIPEYNREAARKGTIFNIPPQQPVSEPQLVEPIKQVGQTGTLPESAPAQPQSEAPAPAPAQPKSEAPAAPAPTDNTIVTTQTLVYGGEVSNSVQPSKIETEGSKLQTKDDRTPIYNDRGDVSALYNPQKEMLYYDPRSGKNVVEPRNRVNTDQLYGRDIERSQTIKNEGNDEAISNAVDTVYSKVMTDMRQMIPTNNSNLQSDMTNIANLTENIMQNPTMERFNARRQFKESSNLSKGNYYNFGQSNRI